MGRIQVGPGRIQIEPDAEALSSAFFDKLKKVSLKVDNSDVLQAMGRIQVGPDAETLSSAVLDKVNKVSLKVDNSDVLQGLRDTHAETAETMQEHMEANISKL